MPGLYGYGNANVTTNVTNTTGLYIGNGSTTILNSAGQLLSLLSNVGTVGFALTSANTQVLASVLDSGVVAGTYGNVDYFPVVTVGGDGRVTQVTAVSVSSATGGYGNANVAAYLPTYTGSLSNSSDIIVLYANAASQADSITLLNANLGAFETYANATFGTSSFGNANVAIYLPTDPTIIALQSNAATQATSINLLNANLGAFETYANATFGTSSYGNSNVASYLPHDPTITGIQANVGAFETYANVTFATKTALQTLDANVGAYETYANSAINNNSTNIQTLNANVGAFETYSNVTFATKTALQTVDANLGTATTNITTLFSNAATQATSIDIINANLGAFETYANSTFGTSSYNNASAAAYIPTDPTITGIQANIGAFETYSNVTFATKSAVQVIDANLGTATTNITTLFSNAASQAGSINTINANLGAYQSYANSAISTNSTNLQTLDANVGAYETYGNLTFATKSALQTVDANLGTATTNITTLFSNAATQATAINTLNANVGAFETYANVQFGTLVYGNTQVAAFLNGCVTAISSPTATSLYVTGNDTLGLTGGSSASLTTAAGGTIDISTTNDGTIHLTGSNVNITNGGTGIGNLILNNGYIKANGTVTGTGFYFYANGVNILTAVNNNIQTISANLGAFETYANATFGTSSYGNTQANALLASGIVSSVVASQINATSYLTASGTDDVNDAVINPAFGAAGGALSVYQGGANFGKSVKIFGNANVAGSVRGGSYFFSNGTNILSTVATATNLQTLDANVGAFETYANSTFLNSAFRFNGNLAGNVLYDSINQRIFANAFPLSAPSTSNGATTAAITNVPVYTGGILQQPASGNQTITAVLSANVFLQTKADATNRNTIGTLQYMQVWPSTATGMTNSDRVRATNTQLDIQLNGKQWGNSNVSAQYSLVGTQTSTTILGSGYAGQAIGQFNVISQLPTGGSANIGYATGSYSLIQTQTTGTGYTASNIGVARLFAGCVTVAGNLSITNAVGLHTANGWGSTATNKYAILNEDATSTITTNGNITQSGFSPALTATFSNVAYTGSMSPGFQFTANTSGSLTGNVFYLGNVNYSSLQQISLDSNISVVSTTAATARQWDFLIFSYGTKTITWPTNSTVYGSIIPNSTTYAKVTQYGSTTSVTVAYTQNPSAWYANVDAQSYTLSNAVLNSYAEKQVALGSQTGTVTIVQSQGPVQTMTLTGSITINTANLSGFTTGESVTLIITQGGSGSYTLTSDMKFAGASKTLSTAVGAIDTLTIYYDGTNYLASLVKGYA